MTVLATLTTIPLQYVLYALLGALILLAVWIVRLELRLRRLLRGSRGSNLESAILHIQNSQHECQQFRSDVERYLNNVEGRLKRSVREVRTVRFNPFKGSGMGGNQSFATALLNEDGDGVILSSLYARDRVSMFAKPVSKYQSEHGLTEEEQAVLRETATALSRK